MFNEGRVLLFFVEKVGVLADEFVSEAATKASVGLAVVTGELDEGLRVGSRFTVDTGFLPCPCHVVVFGTNLRQQRHSAFTKLLVSFVLSVGEKQWHNAVDNQ